MRKSSLRFEISQLRQDKLILAVESLAVFVFALFVSIMLPSLLVRYVYAGQQLLEQPKMLEYIPVAAFVLGVGFFVYAVVSSVAKLQRVRQLTQELAEAEMNDDCCCGGNCGHGDLAELDKMVDEVMKESTGKRSSKKASKSKSSSSKK